MRTDPLSTSQKYSYNIFCETKGLKCIMVEG